LRETVKIYICDLKSADWRELALRENIAPRYMDKILAAKLPKIAAQEAAAGLLLLRCLGVSDDSALEINEYGKPDLKYGGHFSLSHCDDFAVLATASLPLGVDIEKIGRATARIVQKVLPAATGIDTADETEMTRLWTSAEAALKAEGTGFAKNLSAEAEFISKWRIKSIEYSGHIISCAMDSDFEIATEAFEA